MISITKVVLFVTCLTVSTDVVFGQRQSINQRGGGSGGGSDGRNNVKAVNSSSSTSRPTNNAISRPTNIASSVGSTTSNIGYNNGNSGSTTNTVPSSSNNSGGMSNFGNTGTLADRNADVTCPICDAVPDKSYDASVKVNVGEGETWTCGYLQETVQDVDPNSVYADERESCRQSQLKAEEHGCCAQTMYHNQPGADFHDPCFLCGGGSVAANKVKELVNTGAVGSHACGGLDMIMKENIFSANLCVEIIKNAASYCCNPGMSGMSSRSSLRGFEKLRDVESGGLP